MRGRAGGARGRTGAARPDRGPRAGAAAAAAGADPPRRLVDKPCDLLTAGELATLGLSDDMPLPREYEPPITQCDWRDDSGASVTVELVVDRRVLDEWFAEQGEYERFEVQYLDGVPVVVRQQYVDVRQAYCETLVAAWRGHSVSVHVDTERAMRGEGCDVALGAARAVLAKLPERR